MIIRAETPVDAYDIRSMVETAFVGVEHSRQTEGAIIDALRQAGALSLSLVAEQNGVIVGHVAFSPVLINGRDVGWFGLGPVSVSPAFQSEGIGGALIRRGLAMLEQQGAVGCVVLGEPAYYRRFGFTNHHELHYGDVPPEYFQSLVLTGPSTRGEVTYHRGFEAI